MIFFAILGLIILLGIAGGRPTRASYAVVAVAAVVASIYEYLFK